MTEYSTRGSRLRKKITFLAKNPAYLFLAPISRLPYFRFLRETSSNPHPITFRIWFFQKILGINKEAYWPMHFTSKVVGVQNIRIGVGTYPGYNPGIYIQGTGQLTIGKYTHIGQNSGILSGGHDIYNHLEPTNNQTTIGDYCWIGMNSIILPGVHLGNHTIVAAGSIVTKSFPEGHVIVAGNPAKVLKHLDAGRFNEYEYHHRYIGYHREQDWLKTSTATSRAERPVL